MVVDLPSPAAGAHRDRLRADCSDCFGLCCVAPAFAASVDFALDKPAGHPCPHLRSGFSCGIHADLRDSGFRGCTVFDCFGAGQQVAQVTYHGISWREDRAHAAQMFDVFAVMLQLHEQLWYLAEASSWPAARSLSTALADTWAAVDALTAAPAETLASLDVPAALADGDDLLRRASSLVRGRTPRSGRRRGADLCGRDLRRVDLRRAELRGAQLIAADLRGSDLALADLIGADLRDADVAGADLSQGLFVTQRQLDSAAGDAATSIPAGLSRPAHWSRART